MLTLPRRHALVLAGALLAAGCTGEDQEASGDKGASAATDAPSPDPTTGDLIKKFGETVTYGDGTTVSVSAPVAKDLKGKPHAVCTVSVKNGTKEEVPLQFWFVEGHVNEEFVEPVFNEALGTAEPEGMVKPGAQGTFTIGWPRAADQVLTVMVTWRDGVQWGFMDR